MIVKLLSLVMHTDGPERHNPPRLVAYQSERATRKGMQGRKRENSKPHYLISDKG
jgi:hypothetical protein